MSDIKRYAIWEWRGDEFAELLGEYDDEGAAYGRVSTVIGPDIESYVNDDDWVVWVEDRLASS